MAKKPDELFRRRRQRVRYKLRHAGKLRPRLTVFRSSRHIYAQIVDDAAGRTLAAASTLDEAVKKDLKTGADLAEGGSLFEQLGLDAAPAQRQQSGDAADAAARDENLVVFAGHYRST